MKKFLLSIFAVMLAVFSVQAQVWTKVTDASTLKAGDQLVIACSDKGVVASSLSSNYLDKATATFSSDKSTITTLPSNATVLTLGGSEGAWILANATGQQLGATAVKKVAWVGGTKTWAITIDSNGSATIQSSTSSYGRFLYNVTSPRFTTYTSNTNASMVLPQLYRLEVAGEGGGETVVETVATPIITPETTTFNEGESVFVSIATETQDAEIYYTLDGTDPSTENGELYEGEIEITETTTVMAIAVKDGWNNSEVAEAKYTKTVVVEGGVVDVLNLALTGAEGTTYSSWSGKTSKSSAVYAGQSAGGNNSIQLRSSNSNSGIVTTQSGGKVKKISIDWNSNTDVTRELWVYGKNTAYTNPAELYNASTDGDKLAEIAYGTTEFIIEGDYEYIGLRSGSNAMYLNSIEITWVVEEEEPVAETWSSFYAAMDTQIPAGVEAYIVTTANKEYVTLTQIFGTIPAMTGVIFKSNPKSNTGSEELANVEGNLLDGVLMNTNKTEEAYVLGCVDGEYGFYKAEMNQLDGTAWLANAGKAYLPASALPTALQGAASFSFRYEGTTSIEEVETENAVKAIYDLTGRKVNEITAPGIYIVNGKKVLVK